IGRGMRPAILAAVVVSSTACLDTHVTTCGDELVCPPTQACAPAGDRCVLPAQITACDGKPDGDPCSYTGTSGACVDQVCLGTGCGNGVVEEGERCDDGNTMSGDGCSADCRSLERCGNAIVDTAKGEACDCGDGTPGQTPPAQCNGVPNSD